MMHLLWGLFNVNWLLDSLGLENYRRQLWPICRHISRILLFYPKDHHKTREDSWYFSSSMKSVLPSSVTMHGFYPNLRLMLTMSHFSSVVKSSEWIIKSLKAKNSCGYNEISTKILKISGPFISSPINYVCNKMLFWCLFPDRVKCTIIKPLHKHDDRCEVSNYRPLSLLMSF